MKKTTLVLSTALGAALFSGCIKTHSEVEVKPIEIKPVQINLDINLKVQVDKELDSALEGKKSNTSKGSPKDKLFAAMRGRREAITQLRDKGVVGENNQGMLELRVPAKDTDAETVLLMTAENTDRTKLYELIAAEQKTTVDFVIARREARIAERAKSGWWLQNQAGKWYQK